MAGSALAATLSRAWARSARRGWANTVAKGSSRPSEVRIREISRTANSECPPRAKKLS